MINMAEGRIRTRWLIGNFPDPGVPCFTSFLRNEFFHCGLLLLATDASQLNWDGGVTCRMLRLTLLPSPGEKKTISVVKFHVP